MKNFYLLLLTAFSGISCFSQLPNTWVQKANFGGTVRYGANTGFSIGAKGYLGTGWDGNYKNDFWEFDPATNTWTQKANFGGTARFGATGFSIGTKGYIGTGDDGNGYQNDFWEYDPGNNTWTRKADFGGNGRIGAVGFAIGTKGYMGTGYDYNIQRNDFWEYDQGSNTWTQKTNFSGSARTEGAGFAIGTKGYIGTGDNGSGYVNDFWEFDPGTNAWTQKATFGGLARAEDVGFTIGTKGYIGTGYSTGGPSSDLWEYDPGSNSWTQKANFGGGTRYYTSGLSIGGRGYIGLGDGGGFRNDFWEYTPLINSIITGPISGSSICGGATINVSFNVTGVANSGNIFTVQLSNAAGSFASPTTIGTLASTSDGLLNTVAVVPANTPAGSAYRIRVVSSNPAVTGSDNGSNLTITPQPVLNLKFVIQGYYVNGGTMKKVLYNEGVDPNPSSTKVDTVTVELHNTSSPFAVVESYKGVLQTNDSIICSFSCNVAGHSYYIVVSHRNSIQTWSAAPVAFTTTTNYDFTTAANKAYGNDMVQMQAGVWACYSGDINHDTNVDLLDFPSMDFGIVHGLTGYYTSDLNGDGNVDLLDFPMLDANINAGVYSIHP